MNTTPKFNKALAEYFAGLQADPDGGQKRTCRFSGKEFYVRPQDIDFYKKIGVPLPTLEPAERWRRLLAYHNVPNLFHVTSAHSGKSIIAAYPPDTPFKIYEHEAWYSDAWEPFEYGRAWEPNNSFFNQFSELRLAVPRPNLVADTTNTGSDFTNTSTHLKNCYLTFNTMGGENLFYFDCCGGCTDCTDCEGLWNCQDCFGSQMLSDSFGCYFCEHSKNCLQSYFLTDCHNCQNCFMSANLRNKQYYFRNQPLSKKEYQEKIKEVYLGHYDNLQEYLREFEELKKNALYKPDRNFRSVNSYGNYIENSKECYWSWGIRNSQNVNYSEGIDNHRDCYDVVGGGGGELCYELMTISTKDNHGVKFSSQVDNSRDVEYCDLVRNCHDCFGCVGLANKSFCILNRQYSEAEYWKIVDGIKTAMLAAGEYGEFFPPQLMPVPYTIALTASYPGFRDFENAKRYGYDVSEVPLSKSEALENAVASSKLPLDIKDIGDDIAALAVHDEKNDKYFKVTPSELGVYRRKKIAFPREHPLVRLQKFREVYDLHLNFYDRTCKKCGTEIRAVHDPEQYQNVYCEPCYNAAVV